MLVLVQQSRGVLTLSPPAAAKATAALARAEAALSVAATAAGGTVKAPGGPVTPVSPLWPAHMATTSHQNALP